MKFNNFVLLVIGIGIVILAVDKISYNYAMAPTWAEIERNNAAIDMSIKKANASADIATHQTMAIAWGVGSWVLVGLLVAVVAVVCTMYVYVPRHKRMESERRLVDGSLPLQKVITNNGRVIFLDPNKATFGAIGVDKVSGTVLTDADMIGPDRQLEYVKAIQPTRTMAARPIAQGRTGRNEELAAAGYFDHKARAEDVKAQLVEARLLAQRQPDPIVPPAKQLPMWKAKDAFRANTDTTFALGLGDENDIVCWDVESTPHIRVHGKTQGSGKTNLIKEIAIGAVRSGAHVIVLDRRNFKDWSAFLPFIEPIDNRVVGAFAGTVKRIQEIYQERDSLLGAAGVGNLSSLRDAPRRLFVIISEFGSACRAAFDSGELDHVVPALKSILSEAGACGVHLIFEDQVINRNWPQELRGNAEPITGYLPPDSSKAGGYSKAFELERYQFHYDGEKFRTFDMEVEAAGLLFDCDILQENGYLVNTSSFLPSFQNDDLPSENRVKIKWDEEGRKEGSEYSATELQQMIWDWREANQNGRQAEMIRAFAAHGISVTSGYVSKVWNREQSE